MRRENLTAEQLQGAFMKRAGAVLTARGRRMLAWDEALEGGLPRDAVIVAWQGVERGRAAAAAGHDVVMAPHDTTYFNFWQSRGNAGRSPGEPGHAGYLPWTKVLAFDPVPSGLDEAQAAHVLGGEGALWTELVRTPDELDTLLLPRLAALSEALWRGRSLDSGGLTDAVNQASFAARFSTQRAMLDASSVRYFVEPPVGLRTRSVFLDTTSLALAPPALHPDGVVRFTLDGSEPTLSSAVYQAPVEVRATTSVAARLFLPGGRASAVVRGRLEQSRLLPPVEPSMDPSMFREGVLYKYFEGDFQRLPDLAKLTPKRSGRLAAISFDPVFRPERFAVVFEAWLRIPADGVYRFVTRADDGVALDIDGVRVVDDDGRHSARDADGDIALARGSHTIRIAYFQGGGARVLSVACEGPRLPLGPCLLVSP